MLPCGRHAECLMSLYKRLIFPLLQHVDAERAHDLTLRALSVAQGSPAGRFLLRQIAGQTPQRPVSAFGLQFPNELGLAAGYDKNALAPSGLALLGFGHVEVGTVTPWGQSGNTKPRVFRLPAERALINRMGFPNEGMTRVAARLRRSSERAASKGAPFVIGVSLGKQKETPLAHAVDDYVMVMRAVYPYADYLAVNVSSPNTPGLRQLQGKQYLESLLAELQGENTRLAGNEQRKPVLLKIAPDLTWEEIDQILEAAEAQSVAGLIATNTTLEHSGLGKRQAKQEGGLSGAPLGKRSLEVTRYICRQVGGRLPVVSVGGVATADDVRARLDAGACLVQAYTALVYEGPTLPGRILRGLGKPDGSLANTVRCSYDRNVV